MIFGDTLIGAGEYRLDRPFPKTDNLFYNADICA
jgi:hypothetical protein